MDPIASISGLATGIDFRDLVDQIIEAESSRFEYLRVRVSEGQAKKAAWEEVRSLLKAIDDASSALEDGSGLNVFATSILGLNPGILDATASGTARPGRYSVRVLQQAQREQLGSAVYQSRSDALGLSGDFLVGGSVVQVSASDSLQDIAGLVNALNFGSEPSGVSASVVGSSGAYRLVLSASETGSAGIDLLDTSGVLGQLGVLDGTTEIANRTSGGFESQGFSDTTTAVGSLLGFPGGSPSGTVTLGSGASAFNVALDLGSMSLEGVRDAINSAASGAGASMFAEIEADTSGSETVYRLSITGTPAGTDAGAVLQSLGLLQGGRGSVSQVVQGDVLTTDAGGTVATAGTALASLFNGASAAGAAVGDTITFEGTDHLGAAFTFTHTIGGGDTLQTLISRLEGAEGFNGSATVEVSPDGRLTATSATGGASQLSLNVLAGNESGAVLDLGEMQVTDAGRDRLITVGQDAQVEIEGSLVTSASNDITDVIPGVTFSVLGADPDSPLDVVIDRDPEAGVEAMQVFVDAVNAFTAFVGAGIGVTEGEERPALAGDSILRGIRSRLNFVLQATAPAGAAGTFSRLSELGMEITRNGDYTFDAARLRDALLEDADSVQRLFSSFGVGSSSAVTYVGAGANTAVGTYDVVVSQLGSAATTVSVGFGGSYVDDGNADTLTITDTETGSTFDVSLVNGMTLAQIVDAINAELADGDSQTITSSRTMYSDAGASSVATAGTPLAGLFQGAGQPAGFVAGTEITFSGTDPAGNAVLQTFNVTDPNTQTLGTLTSALQSAFGSGTSATIVNGQLQVSDTSQGASQLTVNIGSDIPGNPAPFGVMNLTEVGRGASSVFAQADGGQLRISDQAGSANGFSIGFSAGGSSGVGSLGLGTGSFSGTDVVGTIGGQAATGVGTILTADAGTPAAGLAVRVSGAATGLIGNVQYGSGIMSDIQSQFEELLRINDGQIDEIVERLDESVNRTEDRLEDREARLEDRRQRLIAQFVALETAIARATSLQEQLTSQLGSLPGLNNNS